MRLGFTERKGADRLVGTCVRWRSWSDADGRGDRANGDDEPSGGQMTERKKGGGGGDKTETRATVTTRTDVQTHTHTHTGVEGEMMECTSTIRGTIKLKSGMR